MHPDILRAYDIRGTFGKNLFEKDAITLAHQFKTLLEEKTEDPLTILVGRDGRESSPILHKALTETFVSLGIHVIDLGVISSPMLYFAEKKLKPSGAIMITASHNPKDDNGFKMMSMGVGVFGEEIQYLSTLKHSTPKAGGTLTHKDVTEPYIQHILSALETPHQLKGMRIAWDFAGGAVCAAKDILKKIPGTHFSINDIFDPAFKAHEPDPTVLENMHQLKTLVLSEQCDVGIAFDGDGDRVGVLDHTGAMIDGDRLVTLLAKEVIHHHPGATILADVKSSRVFLDQVKLYGGHPMLTRTGHSYVKAALKKTGALLAGEMSGHIFYADRNDGYDDGLYAGLRLLNILGKEKKSLHALDEALPRYAISPEIRIPYGTKEKFEIVKKLSDLLLDMDIPFLGEDGIRVENEDGWWLLRASNTQDLLILRFEGLDEAALNRIKDHFNHIIRPLDPTLLIKP